MSAVGGVGHHHQHQVSSAEGSSASAATTATSASAATGAATHGGSDPMKALDALLGQIEGAVNAKAIPAHQNW
jgi:hypothetical protein